MYNYEGYAMFELWNSNNVKLCITSLKLAMSIHFLPRQKPVLKTIVPFLHGNAQILHFHSKSMCYQKKQLQRQTLCSNRALLYVISNNVFICVLQTMQWMVVPLCATDNKEKDVSRAFSSRTLFSFDCQHLCLNADVNGPSHSKFTTIANI